MASQEAAIVLSVGMGLVICLASIVAIDHGLAFIALPLGAIGLACLVASWDGIGKWMHHRYLVASYKKQTRDLFVFSYGESDEHEDDPTVIERCQFALYMLELVENPHEVTVWHIMFRDAYAFGHHTGTNGKVVRRTRIAREGLTVRETREDYWQFCESFRAEREQEALEKRRESETADAWVNKHWFGQE